MVTGRTSRKRRRGPVEQFRDSPLYVDHGSGQQAKHVREILERPALVLGHAALPHLPPVCNGGMYHRADMTTRSRLAVLGGTLLVFSASAHAVTPPATKQLSAYLKSTAPIFNLALTGEIGIGSLQLIGEVAGPEEAIKTARLACGNINKAATRMAKVKPPAAMRGPHALVRSAWKQEARTCSAFIQATGDTLAEEAAFEVAKEEARGDESSWRDELVTQLRAAGLVVPKWVKDVAKR